MAFWWPLLEQCIHTVDKVAWAMGDVAPIAARASGGRIQRSDEGNVYDHYDVVYEYPGGIMCHVAQRQLQGAFNEVVDRIYCEKGMLEAPGRVMTKDVSGKITWAYRGEPANMYQVCHNEWFAAIRAGKELNAGEFMAKSTISLVFSVVRPRILDNGSHGISCWRLTKILPQMSSSYLTRIQFSRCPFQASTSLAKAG